MYNIYPGRNAFYLPWGQPSKIGGPWHEKTKVYFGHFCLFASIGTAGQLKFKKVIWLIAGLESDIAQ